MSEGERLTAEKEDRVRVRIASDSLHYATTDEIKADYTLLLTEIDRLRAELAPLGHALAEIESRFPPVGQDLKGRTPREEFCYQTVRILLENLR